MQGIGGGSTFTLGGLLMLYLSWSPVLIWIAIISVVLGTVFLAYVWMRRRQEAREAHGLMLAAPKVESID